jgi:hypothetical protein
MAIKSASPFALAEHHTWHTRMAAPYPFETRALQLGCGLIGRTVPQHS